MLGVKSTFFADKEPATVIQARFGVSPPRSSVNVDVVLVIGARDGRRIDFRPEKVGSLEARPPVFSAAAGIVLTDDEWVRVWLVWGRIVAGSGRGGSGRIDFVLSDRRSLDFGAIEDTAGVGEVTACTNSTRTASKAAFSDLTLFDREIVGSFSRDLVGILVEADRAREDFVGEKILADSVDFTRGTPEGLEWSSGLSNKAVLPLDTSLNSDCRMRFAEFVLSAPPEAIFVIEMDLNGLALACRIKGGAGLPGVPLPAVRGRPGSSRSALEPLRFSDCVVG